MYLKKLTALQIICVDNLEYIKFKNFSNPATFSNESEKAVNELRGAGATITEQKKLYYMINALPPSYSHAGDFMDKLPNEEWTIKYLQNKIKMKSMEEKSKHNDDEED